MQYRALGKLELTLLAFVVFAVLLAWLLPEDVYARSTVARAFADAIASLFGSIDGFAATSSFSGVTRVALATLWCCVPLVALFIAVAPGVLKIDGSQLREMPALVRWAIVAVFLTIAILMPVAFSFENHGLAVDSVLDYLIHFASTQRLGLGLVAGIYCAVSALCLALLPTYLNRRNFR